MGLDGGYEESSCALSMANASFKKCAEGFVFDPVNLFCYKVSDVILANQEMAESQCQTSYKRSMMIEFLNDEQVVGFIELLKSGTVLY